VTLPFFFAEPARLHVAAAGDLIELDGDEGRHAADVRRLRVGELVALTDGAGLVIRASVAEVRRGELTVEVKDRVNVTRPAPRLTVVQALARGGRDELAVEVMTEVGVDQVVGWEASRSIARWTDRTQVKWESTVRAAAKQSRRAWWPEVSGPVTTAEVAALCGSAGLAVVLHEEASEPLATLPLASAADLLVVVGPEGGIADDELAVLREAGGQVVRLGRTVLRSSTAGVAALAVICAATRWA
jgi:16S rRNA (uracil1498-N3)-methyltransferase